MCSDICGTAAHAVLQLCTKSPLIWQKIKLKMSKKLERKSSLSLFIDASFRCTHTYVRASEKLFGHVNQHWHERKARGMNARKGIIRGVNSFFRPQLQERKCSFGCTFISDFLAPSLLHFQPQYLMSPTNAHFLDLFGLRKAVIITCRSRENVAVRTYIGVP